MRQYAIGAALLASLQLQSDAKFLSRNGQGAEPERVADSPRQSPWRFRQSLEQKFEVGGRGQDRLAADHMIGQQKMVRPQQHDRFPCIVGQANPRFPRTALRPLRTWEAPRDIVATS